MSCSSFEVKNKKRVITAYYLKTLYIFDFKVLIDLKQDQVFDHLLSLSDKKQMIKEKINKQTKNKQKNPHLHKKKGKQKK